MRSRGSDRRLQAATGGYRRLQAATGGYRQGQFRSPAAPNGVGRAPDIAGRKSGMCESRTRAPHPGGCPVPFLALAVLSRAGSSEPPARRPRPEPHACAPPMPHPWTDSASTCFCAARRRASEPEPGAPSIETVSTPTRVTLPIRNSKFSGATPRSNLLAPAARHRSVARSPRPWTGPGVRACVKERPTRLVQDGELACLRRPHSSCFRGQCRDCRAHAALGCFLGSGTPDGSASAQFPVPLRNSCSAGMTVRSRETRRRGLLGRGRAGCCAKSCRRAAALEQDSSTFSPHRRGLPGTQPRPDEVLAPSAMPCSAS